MEHEPRERLQLWEQLALALDSVSAPVLFVKVGRLPARPVESVEDLLIVVMQDIRHDARRTN